MASVFPAALSWVEYLLTVSGRTASVLVVASSCGEMLIPLAVGRRWIESMYYFATEAGVKQKRCKVSVVEKKYHFHYFKDIWLIIT